jgi:hypothetical protein
MGNYLLAYRGGRMADTQAERDAQMAKWGAWFGELGDAVVDMGSPFAGSASVSTDGTVGEGAGSGLGGYSVLKADSLAAATELAKGSPVLSNGGSVDVYEAMAVM